MAYQQLDVGTNGPRARIGAVSMALNAAIGACTAAWVALGTAEMTLSGSWVGAPLHGYVLTGLLGVTLTTVGARLVAELRRGQVASQHEIVGRLDVVLAVVEVVERRVGAAYANGYADGLARDPAAGSGPARRLAPVQSD